MITSMRYAGAAAYNNGTTAGDSDVVVSALDNDVWVGTQAFTVPSDWATTTSTISAFRVKAGTSVTLRVKDQSALYIGANPTDDCRFSLCVTSD